GFDICSQHEKLGRGARAVGRCHDRHVLELLGVAALHVLGELAEGPLAAAPAALVYVVRHILAETGEHAFAVPVIERGVVALDQRDSPLSSHDCLLSWKPESSRPRAEHPSIWARHWCAATGRGLHTGECTKSRVCVRQALQLGWRAIPLPPSPENLSSRCLRHVASSTAGMSSLRRWSLPPRRRD